MSGTADDFEQATSIVEAFSEGQSEDRGGKLLAQTAAAIRHDPLTLEP